MPEYSVAVLFDGQGRIKVRANSATEAWEDAMQMDIEDIDMAMFSINPTDVREIQPASGTRDSERTPDGQASQRK